MVKLLACGARGPGFDSRSRRYDFRDLLFPNRDMTERYTSIPGGMGVSSSLHTRPVRVATSSLNYYNKYIHWECTQVMTTLLYMLQKIHEIVSRHLYIPKDQMGPIQVEKETNKSKVLKNYNFQGLLNPRPGVLWL